MVAWWAILSLQTDFGAYIVNTEGTNLREVADRETFAYDSAPSWSPDSCHLIYGLYQNDKSGIYIMDLYDGSIHEIGEGRDPVWKP